MSWAQIYERQALFGDPQRLHRLVVATGVDHFLVEAGAKMAEILLGCAGQAGGEGGRVLDEETVRTRIKVGVPVRVHYVETGDNVMVDRVIIDED